MRNVAFVVALLVVACGKKSAPPAGNGSADDALVKVTAFKDRICACKDKDCATKVHDEYVQWGIAMSKTPSEQRPDEAMTKKMTEVAVAYGDCLSKATSAAPVAPSPPTPAEANAAAEPLPFTGSTGITECDDYKAAVDKLVACDKMPKASRDVMKDAMGQALLSLRSLPADGKKDAATACTMGLDAIKQAASAAGCDVGK